MKEIIPSKGQVSWEEQWALFAEDFRDGKAHINLTRLGGKKDLQLLPGPGFGDLSHPTTNLMLKLMQKHISGCPVIDIGCGSGILTLAAILLGAKSALGIDIDRLALEHAKQNAQLNGLCAQFAESLVVCNPSSILLMNMIIQEQQEVMKKPLQGKLWIVSGILKEQREKYLEQCFVWGWKIKEEKEKKGWLGMVCQP